MKKQPHPCTVFVGMRAVEEENLTGQAIQDFLDREAWQIAEIKQAIIEASSKISFSKMR
ncbi:hypothetical protein [Yersinia aleksiciae]|uniref:hypothetical protein n=1 Tax=Yersinia aleksiciae TaxID=263819 RepID=UPI001643AE95|nr:hypothetical protein [Yersinia aleksiciae]